MGGKIESASGIPDIHTKMKPLNVLIAVQHRIFCDGVKRILTDESDISVIGTVLDINELLTFSFGKVDVLIFDYDQPDVKGTDIIDKLVDAHPKINILVISEQARPGMLKKILKAGASGYLFKKQSGGELKKAIREINAGEKYLCGEAVHLIIEENSNSSSDPADLTDRELEVLILICEELTNREIAKKLNISVRTVDAHRLNILQKTKAKNTAGLVKYAIKHQIFNLQKM